MKLLYVTIAPEDKAQEIAEMLITERLAACVNLFAEGQSFYEWQGAVQCEAERIMIVKTSDTKVQAAIARIVELHPYDCPAILQIPVEAGHGPFLRWVQQQTS